MKKLVILFFTFCVSLNLVAQEEILKAQQKAGEAMQQYLAKDFKTSLRSFEEAFKIKEVQTYNNLYNASCSAALCGDKTKAWKYLELAIAAGFVDYRHIFKDADLNILHQDKKWKKMQSEKGLDLEKIKKAFANLKTEAQLYDLVPFKQGNLYGYMQYGTKKIMVEPMFSKAGFFYKHWDWNTPTGNDKQKKYIELEMGTYQVWIKPNGEIISEFPDSNFPPPAMEMMGDYGSEKFSPKADKEGLGFTEQLGTIVSYSKNYEEFNEMNLQNQLCAKVKYKGMYGIVNAEGNPIAENFEVKYKVLYQIQLYDEQRTPIFYAQNAADQKWSILTTEGKIIIQGLDDSPHHSYNFYLVKTNGKWGAIDLQGKAIIQPKYTAAEDYVFSHQISDEKVRYYFHFKLEGDKDFFYVDENGVEYR